MIADKNRDARNLRNREKYKNLDNENKLKELERMKNFREENKNYFKKYRDENKEQIKEYCSKKSKEIWADEEKREKSKERINTWRKENAERIREYRQNNKERDSHKTREWHKTEQGHILRINATNRYRAKKKQLLNNFTKEQWIFCKEYFNQECAYCGEKKKLAQEHFLALNNNGTYTVDNILPSCTSCNSSKTTHKFYDWYPKYAHYSKERVTKIERYFKFVICEQYANNS